MTEIERDDAGHFEQVSAALRAWEGRVVEVDISGLGTTHELPGALAELRGELRATTEADDPAVARFEVGDGAALAITHEMTAAEWLDDAHLQLQVRQAGVAIIVDATRRR